jgi:hypothetical protein
MGRGGERISGLIYFGEERDRIYGEVSVGISRLGYDRPRRWSDGFDLYGGDTHALTE